MTAMFDAYNVAVLCITRHHRIAALRRVASYTM